MGKKNSVPIRVDPIFRKKLKMLALDNDMTVEEITSDLASEIEKMFSKKEMKKIKDEIEFRF